MAASDLDPSEAFVSARSADCIGEQGEDVHVPSFQIGRATGESGNELVGMLLG